MKSAIFKVVGGDFNCAYVLVTPTYLSLDGVLYETSDVVDKRIVSQNHKPKYDLSLGLLGMVAFGPIGLWGGVLSNKANIKTRVLLQFKDGKSVVIECEDNI